MALQGRKADFTIGSSPSEAFMASCSEYSRGNQEGKEEIKGVLELNGSSPSKEWGVSDEMVNMAKWRDTL